MEEQAQERVRKRRRSVPKPSGLLRVYRYVFQTDAPKHKRERDKEKPNVRLVRDIKEKSPAQFIAKMQELEGEYAASRGEVGESAAVDEGSKKVLDLVEQLLDDLQAKTKTQQLPQT